MLEFLAPKNKQFFRAKWVDGEDDRNNGYFKFSKPDKEVSRKTSNGNITVATGDAIWETKTTLPIKTDDICWFEGRKYFVLEVKDADSTNSSSACLFFKENGNKTKIITLCRAG